MNGIPVAVLAALIAVAAVGSAERPQPIAAATASPCANYGAGGGGASASGDGAAGAALPTAPPLASLPTMPPDLPPAPPGLPQASDPAVQAAIASGTAALCGAMSSPAPTNTRGTGPLVGFSPAVAAAIEAAAAQYGLNPCLLGAIAMQESSGNPNAIGHDPNGQTVGYGLFQITVGAQPFSPQWANPTVNADQGASMVASAFAQYPNPQQALTYYNCGNLCGSPPNPAYTTKTNGLTYPDSVLAKEAQVCPGGQSGAMILWRMMGPMVGAAFTRRAAVGG